jgi:hypothetical protein
MIAHIEDYISPSMRSSSNRETDDANRAKEEVESQVKRRPEKIYEPEGLVISV